MIRYQPAIPRVASGLAAMLMAALTIGALVVLPSKMEPDSQVLTRWTGASSAAQNPCVTRL
jgi:hypothetical protein